MQSVGSDYPKDFNFQNEEFHCAGMMQISSLIFNAYMAKLLNSLRCPDL